MKQYLLAMMFAAAATSASAATISFGPVSSNARGPDIQFNNLIAPPNIVGDATLTFSVRGDLNWRGEYVDVSIDGFSLGRVFDNNTGNDAFDFANDRGTQHTSLHTGTATIARDTFANFIADGALNLRFDFSRYVDFRGSVRHLSGQITYNSDVDRAPAPVPLPAAGGLMGLALAGFAALRRRKKSA